MIEKVSNNSGRTLPQTFLARCGGRKSCMPRSAPYPSHLDAAEAIRFERAVERWWGRAILRFQADHVRLLRAADDPVLGSAVVKKILPT